MTHSDRVMIGSPPAYFEDVRRHAAQRWNQLEADEELAAPWRLLFEQIQSPRHVLSELLQNADDAGATNAWVSIEEGEFIFGHDGADFSEEEFASLCRFGCSNKRALHTVGFCGVGFKSTFSIGDEVTLLTPTLSVSFKRQRFTEPVWICGIPVPATATEVRVIVRDAGGLSEISKNLDEWQASPISVLFFQHLRSLRINGQELRWCALGPGPVPGSEWMALDSDPRQPFLVARFDAQRFPDEALDEIRKVRCSPEDSVLEWLTPRIEIVVGAEGRLYVVLPTEVATGLPFACNAPFIQDPARSKIEDPATSPTNRWLLEQIGTLAASLMMHWLEAGSLDLGDRAIAYTLLPETAPARDRLAGSCVSYVEQAFDAAIAERNTVLTESGELVGHGEAVALPDELTDVWPHEKAASLLDAQRRPPLASEVSQADEQKLINRGLVDQIGRTDVMRALCRGKPPKPRTWSALLDLWAYIAPEFSRPRALYLPQREDANIFPVRGSDLLHPSSAVVRLAEKRLLQTEEDWEFLAACLLVLNQNWVRFLTEQHREAEAKEDEKLFQAVRAANSVLEAVGLDQTSDVSKIIDQVAKRFFGSEAPPLGNCIRLAQIAAKLDATIKDSFRFVTRDSLPKPRSDQLFLDGDGGLEALLPEDQRSTHMLHEKYVGQYKSCTAEEWSQWVSKGRAGLLQYPPFVETEQPISGKDTFEKEIKRRGASSIPYWYHFVTQDFVIQDQDFEEEQWDYWQRLSIEDASIWATIMERILSLSPPSWNQASSAKALQIATTGNTRRPDGCSEDLLPSWILKFRELPCLPDSHGAYRKPDDLLRRTPETESVRDVEDFVHSRLDTEANRGLLGLLGVRDVPTGPDRLLNCLRALAKSETPPCSEVDKWYARLDQFSETCSTEDLGEIKTAFWEERLVLTESHGWSTASGVFLSVHEQDVPGAATVRSTVRDLSLWQRIEVPEHPTAELAIGWLQGLPSGEALGQADVGRVRALLARYPGRIWSECEHWLNLEGEWAPTRELRFSLTKQSPAPWEHLHQWVKQQTADCRPLSTGVIETPPFSDLEPLARRIEERLDGSHNGSNLPSEREPWLVRVGEELSRVEFEDTALTERVRELARRLAGMVWRRATSLEITPYIDGVPAGEPQRAHAVWLEDALYVEALPKARLAQVVPEVLAKSFDKPEITAALNYCFERSPAEVSEYMTQNFNLVPVEDKMALDLPRPESGTAESAPTALAVDADAAHEGVGEEDLSPDSTAEKLEDLIAAFDLDAESLAELQQFTALDTRARSTKPDLVERFAHKMGFRANGANSFRHPDGRSLVRVAGGLFPWELRDASGQLMQRYWEKERCLEKHALEIPFEVWRELDEARDTNSLLLVNEKGEPVELSGTRLRALVDKKKVKIFEAAYRLVYVSDDEH